MISGAAASCGPLIGWVSVIPCALRPGSRLPSRRRWRAAPGPHKDTRGTSGRGAIPPAIRAGWLGDGCSGAPLPLTRLACSPSQVGGRVGPPGERVGAPAAQPMATRGPRAWPPLRGAAHSRPACARLPVRPSAPVPRPGVQPSRATRARRGRALDRVPAVRGDRRSRGERQRVARMSPWPICPEPNRTYKYANGHNIHVAY